MKFKTLRPFCRCRLVVYAHCWRTWKTSRIWRMTQIIFSLLPHDYPVGCDSGILFLSALFFPLCHCTIKHLFIHVRPPARHRHHIGVCYKEEPFSSPPPLTRASASCHWLIKGISESIVSRGSDESLWHAMAREKDAPYPPAHPK